MSRFADPSATRVVDVGPCQCPGTPHDVDQVTIRWQLGASALARIGRAELEGAVRLDPMAAYRQTVLETVVEWNFLWLDPQVSGDVRQATPVPVTTTSVAELDVETLKFIAETADRLIQDGGALPNGSGAPSRASSRGSASPTRRPSQKPST